jgi:hypothetical protein
MHKRELVAEMVKESKSALGKSQFISIWPLVTLVYFTNGFDW